MYSIYHDATRPIFAFAFSFLVCYVASYVCSTTPSSTHACLSYSCIYSFSEASFVNCIPFLSCCLLLHYSHLYCHKLWSLQRTSKV
ncbi:hypothetical protein LXA43DRAFT_53187 [Ganoderma leucocontextum]|nr:hypothetical protein LXA43DRAFT_53187 [Ganoderma leucocontextum]